MTLVAILATAGARSALPVVLALLIYTISLRLAFNTCFYQNYPVMSRFLYAVPLLGTFCMAGVELVHDMQSSALAVVVLLLSAFPFVTTVIHHGRRCEETPLPISMRNIPHTISDSSDMTVVSNYINSEVRPGHAL